MKNRYEKILSRKDKRRPKFVSELMDKKHIPKNGLVLKIKVLTEDGGTVTSEWSEKLADAAAKRAGK